MKNSLGLMGFKFITIAFVIAIITCGIVDMAVSGTVTWSKYPFISIVYSWLLLTPPLVLKKNKIFSMLTITSVATLPYLFLLDSILPGRVWFLTIGAPVGITSLAALWITYSIFKYLRMNNWFKAALTVFLYGIVLNGVVLYSVGTFMGDSMGLLLTLNSAITFAVVIGLVVILLAQGFGKQVKHDTAKMSKEFQN